MYLASLEQQYCVYFTACTIKPKMITFSNGGQGRRKLRLLVSLVWLPVSLLAVTCPFNSLDTLELKTFSLASFNPRGTSKPAVSGCLRGKAQIHQWWLWKSVNTVPGLWCQLLAAWPPPAAPALTCTSVETMGRGEEEGWGLPLGSFGTRSLSICCPACSHSPADCWQLVILVPSGTKGPAPGASCLFPVWHCSVVRLRWLGTQIIRLGRY